MYNLNTKRAVVQEGGAVDESFTPPFDTTGVLESAAISNGRIG